MDATQQLVVALQRFLLEKQSQLQQAVAVEQAVVVNTPQIQEAEAAGRARAEIEQRTYHMGKKPTLGKDYDDRLTARLGCSPTTAYLYLGLAEHRGGIRHRRFGKKYHITERALREWEGDAIKQES
jgi:hypothetical protein